MRSECSILLVDDIPEYLDTMELNVPDGCRVLRAISLDEAKTLAEKENPLVAVIDIRLSEEDAGNRDGLKLLKWMRIRHPRTVVIMVSAYREFEYRAESVMLGAEEFLGKPIRPDEFRAAIAKARAQGGSY